MMWWRVAERRVLFTSWVCVACLGGFGCPQQCADFTLAAVSFGRYCLAFGLARLVTL